MSEDTRPGHEFARSDDHADFAAAVPEVELGAPEDAPTADHEPGPVDKPEDVDPSQSNLRGGVEVSADVDDSVPEEPAEEEDEPASTDEVDFDALTKAELSEFLDNAGVNVSSRATKDELVALAKEQ